MNKTIKFLIVLSIAILGIIIIPQTVEAATYKNKSSTINVKINGTDLNYKTNTLTASNISVYVGGTQVTPTTKTLSSATSITNGVQYTVTLSGVSGEGALTIKIAANTLEDQASNKNVETTIDTGITMDNTAPAFATNSFTYNTPPYDGVPITIKATATDAASGIDYICVNGTNTSYGGATSGTPTGTVYDSYSWNTFYAVDKAGNRSQTYTYVLQINYTIRPNHTTKVMDVAAGNGGFTNSTNVQIYDSGRRR